MTDKTLLCVGDIDLDLLVAVPQLPTFDSKMTGRRLGEWPGGMAANVAVAAARLGQGVRLAGVVGDDREGRTALEWLREEHVDTRHCVMLAETQTFMCVVLIGPEGQKALVRLDTPAFMPTPEQVPEAAFEGVAHVHLNGGSMRLVEHCIHHARTAGAGTSLDLEAADIPEDAGRLVDVLTRTDVLFLNRETHERLRHRLELQQFRDLALVITLGGDGAIYRDADSYEHLPGMPVDAVDTTGAGDCFAAAFLHQRLQGASPSQCLRFANAAAALSTQGYGAQGGLPNRASVEARLQQTSSTFGSEA